MLLAFSPFDKLDGAGILVLGIVALAMLTGIVLGGPRMLTDAFKSVAVARAELALKREMVGRGMSAEEIALVMGAGGRRDGAAGFPLACEAVARKDDEWCAALVLQAAEGR